MKVVYSKKFLKELSKLPKKYRIQIEEFVFEKLPQLENVYESTKIESLKGYKNFYKVRFGNYRIGLKISKEILSVERVLHRKDIYKRFP